MSLCVHDKYIPNTVLMFREAIISFQAYLKPYVKQGCLTALLLEALSKTGLK